VSFVTFVMKVPVFMFAAQPRKTLCHSFFSFVNFVTFVVRVLLFSNVCDVYLFVVSLQKSVSCRYGGIASRLNLFLRELRDLRGEYS
jgi:putative copper export protein